MIFESSLKRNRWELGEIESLAKALMHKNNNVERLELAVGLYNSPEHWSAPPNLHNCGLGIEEVKVLAEALMHENNKVEYLR